jgi:penicillin-binding protein 2
VESGIEARHFDVVADGMANVFKAGTASAYSLPDIEMCGKTGTVENFRKIQSRYT